MLTERGIFHLCVKQKGCLGLSCVHVGTLRSYFMNELFHGPLSFYIKKLGEGRTFFRQLF